MCYFSRLSVIYVSTNCTIHYMYFSEFILADRFATKDKPTFTP